MVNDPILNSDLKSSLLNYDTFQGKANFEVIETGSSLTIDGKMLRKVNYDTIFFIQN